MGVMSCYRMACENIMCDTYVPEIGYICYECQKEFKESMERERKFPSGEGEILNELEKFMASYKNRDRPSPNADMSIDELFKTHTRDRYYYEEED